MTPYSLAGKKVFVAGHRGMVGKALIRRLKLENCHILSVNRELVDLRRQSDVEAWMESERPQVVFLAAAKVGGILANATRPAEFLYDNLMIEANVIEAARMCNVERLIFLGSSCIYPKMAPQPITEDALLTGPLEPTNEWYAIAKIAGLKLVQSYRKQYGCDFISAQPTNLYGPGDNFNLQSSHVLPALLLKAHLASRQKASSLEVWGTGKALREFLHVDDLADALVFLAKFYADECPINIGSGSEVSIRQLAEEICQVTEFDGDLVFDHTKPDGTPRKRLDTTRMTELGWNKARPLRLGLQQTYRWLLESLSQIDQAN